MTPDFPDGGKYGGLIAAALGFFAAGLASYKRYWVTRKDAAHDQGEVIAAEGVSAELERLQRLTAGMSQQLEAMQTEVSRLKAVVEAFPIYLKGIFLCEDCKVRNEEIFSLISAQVVEVTGKAKPAQETRQAEAAQFLDKHYKRPGQ